MEDPDLPDRAVERVLFGDLRLGETPMDDFSGLKVPEISTLHELGLHETANIANAVVDYFRQEARKRISFDLEGVKGIHRDMFCDVWDWAGQFRQKENDSIQFASKFAHIQEHLHNLLEDLKVWQASDTDPIEQAARLHHRAVQIHPFANGNGRWSRILTNVSLLERHKAVVEWPATIGERVSPIRNEYIAALKAADDGEMEQFVELHRRITPMPARPVVSQPLARPWTSAQYRVVQSKTQPPRPSDDE